METKRVFENDRWLGREVTSSIIITSHHDDRKSFENLNFTHADDDNGTKSICFNELCLQQAAWTEPSTLFDDKHSIHHVSVKFTRRQISDKDIPFAQFFRPFDAFRIRTFGGREEYYKLLFGLRSEYLWRLYRDRAWFQEWDWINWLRLALPEPCPHRHPVL